MRVASLQESLRIASSSLVEAVIFGCFREKTSEKKANEREKTNTAEVPLKGRRRVERQG